VNHFDLNRKSHRSHFRLINRQGEYKPPSRQAADYENTVGEWRDKHILGTELGPNENGRHWPSRHEAERANR